MKAQNAAAMALLFISLALLPGCTTLAGKTNEQLWGSGWPAEALILSVIMIFMTAIAFMFGYGLNVAGLKNWGKNELYQAVASAMIVFALIVVLSAIDASMPSELGCSQPGCHIQVARDYATAMYSNLREMNKGILKTTSNLLVIQSLSFFLEQLTPPLITIQIAPFMGMSILTDSLKTAFDIIMKVMLLMKSIEIFFDFIQNVFYPSFLILGVIMRAFFFTRRLGGLLIAVAIGLYFVFPLVYLLAHAIVGAGTAYTYVLILDSSPLEQLAMHKNAATGNYEPYERDAKGNARQSMLSGVATSIVNFIRQDERIIGENGILEKTAMVLVYATFVPFISLITTISFIKVLSPALGGDVEIAGLTRLI